MADDKVAEMRAALETIESELREEYGINGTAQIPVGSNMVDLDVQIEKSFFEYADGTVENAIDAIKDLLDDLADRPPNFGEIDSGVLTNALADRIDRECSEGIERSTSYQVWGAPYKNLLLTLLRGAAPAGGTSTTVNRLVKAGDTVLREIQQEEAEEQRAQQEEQLRVEQLEAARQETAEARTELARERELRQAAEQTLVDANAKAAADLLAAQERIVVAQNAPRPRIPWSFARGDAPTAKSYPEVFDPPAGYDWTGEFRNPGKFEPFLMTNGRPTAGAERPQKQPRVILRKLASKEKPSWPNTGVQDPGQDERPAWERDLAIDVLTKDYPEKFRPPLGYDWTGQISTVKKGDYWLALNGAATGPALNDKVIQRAILRKLDKGEQPSFGLTGIAAATNGRLRWPGSNIAAGLAPYAAPFAQKYEPPTGYEWAEYRAYKAGDVFLSSSGRIEYVGTSYTGEGNLRHILRPVTAQVLQAANSYVIGSIPGEELTRP